MSEVLALRGMRTDIRCPLAMLPRVRWRSVALAGGQRMSGRPSGALSETVARQIVQEYRGDTGAIAVALAREITDRGGWKANTCKPLHRAFGLASGQEASE